MTHKKIAINTLKVVGIGILTLILLITLFVNLHPVFGGTPDEQSWKKMVQSSHFNGEVFVNLVPTILATPEQSEYNVSMLDFFFPREGKNPHNQLPSKQLDKSSIPQDSITWLGHSTVIVNTNGRTIITDPVFHRASPVPISGDPFETEHGITIADLPSIDIVVISHDHYDHLDYHTIQELEPKVDKFFVPLGVKAHFQKWNVPEEKLVEMDWYEQTTSGPLTLTFAPARHFSGRGLIDQYSTQWGSWIITSPTLNVYFSGDTGYFEEFKKIGENYGPFDIAFVDSGAYDNSWNQIHLLPEESVQANIDLQSRILLPIGWGKFDLAFHPWNEPVMRVTTEAKKRNVTVATPLIGETFTLDEVPQAEWW